MSQKTQAPLGLVNRVNLVKLVLLAITLLAGLALLPVIQVQAHTHLNNALVQAQQPPKGTPAPVAGDNAAKSAQPDKAAQAVAQIRTPAAPVANTRPTNSAQPGLANSPAQGDPPPGPTPPPVIQFIQSILQKLVTVKFPENLIKDGIRGAGFSILKGEYVSARSSFASLAASAGFAKPSVSAVQIANDAQPNRIIVDPPKQNPLVGRCKDKAGANRFYFGVNPIVCDIGWTMTQVAIPIWALSLALLGLAVVTNNVSAAGYSLRDIGQEFIRWILICLFSGNGIVLATVVHNLMITLSAAILDQATLDSTRLAQYMMPMALVSKLSPATSLIIIAIVMVIALVIIISMALAMLARYVLTLTLVAMAPLAIAAEGIPPLRFVFKDWLSSFLRVELLTVLNAIVVVIATNLLFSKAPPPDVPPAGVNAILESLLSIMAAIGVISIITAMNWSVFRYVFGTALDIASQLGKAVASVIGMVATFGASALGGGVAAAAVSTAGQLGAATGSPLGQAFNQGTSAAQGILDRRDRSNMYAANMMDREQRRAEFNTQRSRSGYDQGNGSSRSGQNQQSASSAGTRSSDNAQRSAENLARREAGQQRDLMRAVGANSPATEAEVNDAVEKLAQAGGMSKAEARQAFVNASGAPAALAQSAKGGDLGSVASGMQKASWGEVAGSYAEEKLRSEGKLKDVAPIFGAPPVASSVASATSNGWASAGSSNASGANNRQGEANSPGTTGAADAQSSQVNQGQHTDSTSANTSQSANPTRMNAAERTISLGASTSKERNSTAAAINGMHDRNPQQTAEIERGLDAATPMLNQMAGAAGGLQSAATALGFKNAGGLVAWATQQHMEPVAAARMSGVPVPREANGLGNIAGYQGLNVATGSGADIAPSGLGAALSSREATLQAAAINPNDANERRSIGDTIQRLGPASGSSNAMAEQAVQTAGQAVRAMDTWSGSSANTLSALRSNGYTGDTRNHLLESLATQHLNTSNPSGGDIPAAHPIQPSMFTASFGQTAGNAGTQVPSASVVNIPSASNATVSTPNSSPYSAGLLASIPSTPSASSASPPATPSIAQSAISHIQPAVQAAEGAARGMAAQAGSESHLIQRLQQGGWSGSSYPELVASLSQGSMGAGFIPASLLPAQAQSQTTSLPSAQPSSQALPQPSASIPSNSVSQPSQMQTAPSVSAPDPQSQLDAMGANSMASRTSIQQAVRGMYQAALEMRGDIDQALVAATPVVSQMAVQAGSLDAAVQQSGFNNAGSMLGWVARQAMPPALAQQMPSSIQPPRHSEVFGQLQASSASVVHAGDAVAPVAGNTPYAMDSGSAHIVRLMTPMIGGQHAHQAVSAAETMVSVLSATNGLDTAMTHIPAGTSAMTPRTRAVAAFAGAYAASSAMTDGQGLPQLEAIAIAPRPQQIIGQNPVFAGLQDADGYAPIFARAQAVSNAASNAAEWQPLGQGIQSVTNTFGTDQAGQVNQGINQIAPLYGALLRQAGGATQLVSRLNNVGASVQSPDQAFAGLVSGYLHEQGLTPQAMPGEALSQITPINATTIQRAFPEFQQAFQQTSSLDAQGQASMTQAPSLAGYSQALPHIVQSLTPVAAPLASQTGTSVGAPQANLSQHSQALPDGVQNLTSVATPMTPQPGAGFGVAAPNPAAIAMIPGFDNLPTRVNLAQAIGTRAETLAVQQASTRNAAELMPLTQQFASALGNQPAQAAIQSAQQLVEVMAHTGGLEPLMAGLAPATPQFASPYTRAVGTLAAAFATTTGAQPASPLPHLGVAPPAAMIQAQSPVFAGINVNGGTDNGNADIGNAGSSSDGSGYSPLFARAQVLQGIAHTPAEWQQVGQGMQALAQGYAAAPVQEALQVVAPMFREMVSRAGGYDQLVNRFTSSGTQIQSAGQLVSGLAAGYLQERDIATTLGGTALLPLTPELIQNAFPEIRLNSPPTFATYGTVFTPQTVQAEPASPAAAATPLPGASLYRRSTQTQRPPHARQDVEAQPQTPSDTISDGGGSGNASQTPPSSSPLHTNAYVNQVLQGYGPSAQLSDAASLQLNPGDASAVSGGMRAAHINLAANINDNIGAGPSLIRPMANTLAQLGREPFGNDLVRQVVEQAQVIGSQSLSPDKKFAQFGEFLKPFIARHLPDTGAVRNDDPQVRDDRRKANRATGPRPKGGRR